MREYPKIQTIWKRDEKGKIIPFQYATPELEFLADCDWEWTEKVDGTNIRVHWNGERVVFGGRTDNAQIPAKLVDYLSSTFTAETMEPVIRDNSSVTLFGEGYGAGIQKGGGNYRPDQKFILFDVLVGRWWLRQEQVGEVAAALSISVVPLLGRGTLAEMAAAVSFDSLIACVPGTRAEGIVGRTPEMLLDRRGEPIFAKIKARDYA